MPRVQTREPAIGRGKRADRMRNIRRLGASPVGQHLDHRVVAVRQQARPVGRDLAPKLLSRTLADKRALGAIAIDQPFAFEHVERFANGCARHTAFSRQIVHRRHLFGDRPVARLDAAAEQARELDVTRDDASIQIDGRSFALRGLHFVFDFVLRDPRLFHRIARYVIKLTYRSMPAIGEKTAVTISAMGSLLLAAGFALCGVAVAAAAERRSELVHYNDVQIDVVIDGSGPAVVLLPSLARDSDDYDEVAEGLAAAGFRVLRPKPRGIGRSTGPMTKITLHDFARDIAEVVKKLGGGKAVVVGHAYGNWVARMTAADHPDLVRGVVIAAAAAKQYAPELSTAVTNAGNLSLSDEERLAALRFAFFAPGNDPTVWLKGWHPEIRDSQRAAAAAVKQDEWWSGGTAPLLDLQAENDPFKPESKRNEMKNEFGSRVTVMVIPNASHALIPEQPKAVVEALSRWIKSLP